MKLLNTLGLGVISFIATTGVVVSLPTKADAQSINITGTWENTLSDGTSSTYTFTQNPTSGRLSGRIREGDMSYRLNGRVSGRNMTFWSRGENSSGFWIEANYTAAIENSNTIRIGCVTVLGSNSPNYPSGKRVCYNSPINRVQQ